MEQSLPQLVLPIKMEKSSERLTSLGGLVVLEELARAVGVWKQEDRVLPGPKSGRGYHPRKFVRALVWMLHAGGRRLEDLRELREEREVLEQLGLQAVPDAGTVGDWLRRQGKAGADAVQEVSRGLVEKCLEPEAEEVILDVGATEIEAEKQEAQWTYNHVQGYMPLLGYVNGVCVAHEFREGNRSPSGGILELARRCEAALPAGKHVYFRSDSAAYQAEVINHYSQAGRSFRITADLDAAVKREIQHLPEAAWQPYRTAEGMATDREIAETVHTLNATKEALRLIVLRWKNPQPSLFEADRYCYHAVATNRKERACEVIWKHNERGNCENWHKELKIGFGMEQMPCGQLEANALYFAIGVLAYNLVQGYCVCVIDPEGDYSGLESLPGVLVLGGKDPPPDIPDVARALRHFDLSVVIDLSREPYEEKVTYLKALLPMLASSAEPRVFRIGLSSMRRITSSVSPMSSNCWILSWEHTRLSPIGRPTCIPIFAEPLKWLL